MRARVLVLALLLPACASSSNDRVLQAAIEAGNLACASALNDPATKWGDGAREYCERVVNGCPK